MKIMELLALTGHPVTFVQGHHTRILVFDGGGFEVRSRRYVDDPSSPYETEWYYGGDEEEAVEAFLESERR